MNINTVPNLVIGGLNVLASVLCLYELTHNLNSYDKYTYLFGLVFNTIYATLNLKICTEQNKDYL